MSATSTSAPSTWAERTERWLTRHGALAALGLLVVATALGGAVAGARVAILVLAGGALVAAIAAFWSSLRALFGERTMSAAEAFAFAAPSGEDEQKRAVLRALQDLEYERSVGKIAEQDFARLRDRYRAEAGRLLELEQQADEPLRQRVEQLVAEHLAAAEARESDEDVDEDDEDVDDPAAGEQDADDEDDEARSCPQCSTHNDDDARFCKKCGQRLGSESSPEHLDDGPEGGEPEP